MREGNTRHRGRAIATARAPQEGYIPYFDPSENGPGAHSPDSPPLKSNTLAQMENRWLTERGAAVTIGYDSSNLNVRLPNGWGSWEPSMESAVARAISLCIESSRIRTPASSVLVSASASVFSGGYARALVHVHPPEGDCANNDEDEDG